MNSKAFSEQVYQQILEMVQGLKSEVPDGSMLDLLALMEVTPGRFEVPKYDPLWEIVKRVNMVLPLVRLANNYQPHADLEAVIKAGEMFVATEPRVVFDEPDQCFTDDDEPEHQHGALPALPFGDQDDREAGTEQTEG